MILKNSQYNSRQKINRNKIINIGLSGLDLYLCIHVYICLYSLKVNASISFYFGNIIIHDFYFPNFSNKHLFL